MKQLWRTLVELFDVLPKGAKPFYIAYSILTGALAILDTLALALIVAVVTPVASGAPITLPLIGEIPTEATVWIVLVICALFLLKGVLAIVLHWFATRRFAKYELEVGNALFRAYTHSSWEKRSQISTAEVTRIVDSSMANANMGFILPLSQVPGNVLTFVSVLTVLVIAQPSTAIIALIYLLAFSALMLLVISRRARKAGQNNRKYAYRVATIMTEMVEALKEVVLRGKLDDIGQVVSDNRRIATRARANISFLGIVPKYAFESALIGGFVVIGGSAYLMGGMAAAMTAVALFAATGFRMIPAMTTVQSAFTTAGANEVYARDVIRELAASTREDVVSSQAEDRAILPPVAKAVELRDVGFRYPGAEKNVLDGLTLTVPFGSSLAVVGPSGAGKSTLIDILLGLSLPTAGELLVDGVPIAHVMKQWRTQVGYVPQRVALFDASIAQNVALTWRDDYDPDKVRSALERAHLGELALRGRGIEEHIGERGTSISGGQQQRLGIARALYSNPRVMVMDEATSSLDTATENRVTESMRDLKGEVTFVTVAHRLSTIRDYDQVCYLDKGRILGRGSFEDVVDQVPEFRLQAELAGLL
ncbi:ABC transporter ATP-binding protein [Leucobacter chromiiresistens]|uniref:ABC-type bacteriocin/lantibiotic exporter, contains an N-terminal double-glycine peptidase domain n=1 Tax=Leucobacter chromiiresistens TaxID=1079994 RepID=A0A1H0YY45_9MICO|nr:ABC transporter ATP-binding protein [Leucobacter chromiiresistens]SDQ19756.1 ABC-type bacteriocin/lantibiotic exporter, contains an N-terminal double-glycine peptidase domain [Leucobacter chromiiresistens]